MGKSIWKKYSEMSKRMPHRDGMMEDRGRRSNVSSGSRKEI